MSNGSQITEVREVFFDVLRKAGVPSKAKFSELDVDFSNFEELCSLAVGERKQLFAEYQTFAAKQEKEEKRLARIDAKENLHRFLDELVEEFDPDMTFRQFAAACSDLPFWSVLDLEEIESIFQDFVEEFQDKYMYKVKERHYQLKRDCFSFLDKVVFHDTPIDKVTWENASAAIDGNESFNKLDQLDKFDVYEDVFRDRIEEIHIQNRRANKRIARKRREAFTACLEARKDDIASGIKWSDFVESVRSTEAYLDLIGTKHCSQPYDLFAEYRSKLKRE